MKTIFYSLVFLLGTTFYIQAQGCSDAGICSLTSIQNKEISTYKNLLEIGAIYGLGLNDIQYYAPYVTYKRDFNAKWAMSGKITYSQAQGEFGTRGQFGDAYLSGIYKSTVKDNKQWRSLLAFKFPFSSGNLKISYNALPMDYQASLGTFDCIVSESYGYHHWDFNLAFQIPVFNNNRNSYFKEYAPTNEFVTTNLFERKPDALFRTSYTINATSSLSFKPNFLFIYHLGNDTYEDIFGNRKTIENSEGLTINANLVANYSVSKQSTFEFNVASPLVVREIRPDGLTRSLTVGLIYKYMF